MKTTKQIVIENADKSESLTYRSIATKAKNNADGFLYVHSWNNGFQELIFISHDKAKRFFN